MILKALVLDTNDFKTTGKIKVRVAAQYLGEMVWDLAKNPNFVSQGSTLDEDGFEVHSDYDVSVFTPIGVGGGNSLFYLPRVNSVGLIATIGFDNSKEFIWLGGMFENVLDESFIPSINMPNDKDTDEVINGATDGVLNVDRENALILRLKSTKMPIDYATAPERVNWFDWKERPTENLIVVDDFKIKAKHFIEYNGKEPALTQELFMGSDFSVEDNKVKRTNDYIKLEQWSIDDNSKNQNSYIHFDKDKVKLTYLLEDAESEDVIELSKTGITLKTVIGDKNILIEQNKNGISLSFGETSIMLNKKSISINAEQEVIVSAKQVRLGNTDQHVVTTTSSITNFKIADGIFLNASQNVFG